LAGKKTGGFNLRPKLPPPNNPPPTGRRPQKKINKETLNKKGSPRVEDGPQIFVLFVITVSGKNHPTNGTQGVTHTKKKQNTKRGLDHTPRLPTCTLTQWQGPIGFTHGPKDFFCLGGKKKNPTWWEGGNHNLFFLDWPRKNPPPKGKQGGVGGEFLFWGWWVVPGQNTGAFKFQKGGHKHLGLEPEKKPRKKKKQTPKKKGRCNNWGGFSAVPKAQKSNVPPIKGEGGPCKTDKGCTKQKRGHSPLFREPKPQAGTKKYNTAPRTYPQNNTKEQKKKKKPDLPNF